MSYTRNRNVELDVLKGILISLMVLGHVIGSLNKSSLVVNSDVTATLMNWIYSFHMEAFFIISGMLFPGSLKKSLKSVIKSKASTLYWPYLLWGTIYLTLEYISGKVVSFSWERFILLPFEPVGYGTWFLLTMFLISLVCSLIYKKARKPQVWFVFIAFIWILTNPLGLDVPDTVQNAINFIPFFIIGSLYYDEITSLAKKTNSILSVLIISSSILMSQIGFEIGDAAHLLNALLGAFGVYSLIYRVEFLKIYNIFSFLGKVSLKIFLIHGIVKAPIVWLILNKFSCLSEFFQIFSVYFLTLILTVFLCLVLDKFKLRFLFSLK
ncbi:membrane hypothetical protein [Vibrio chagasii]|nr:membrane hypothetical protein [Vibrio chagasii]